MDFVMEYKNIYMLPAESSTTFTLQQHQDPPRKYKQKLK